VNSFFIVELSRIKSFLIMLICLWTSSIDFDLSSLFILIYNINSLKKRNKLEQFNTGFLYKINSNHNINDRIKESTMGDNNSDTRNRIKHEDQYENLKEKGMSKEKAARIANSENGGKGGKNEKYEKWTKDELYEKAEVVGIEGRSNMDKDEIIHALRNQ